MWELEPRIPLGLWWALAVAALCALIAYAARRGWRIALLRRVVITLLLTVGLSCPLLILLNPTYIETIPPVAGQPRISVVVDGTSSMKCDDAIARSNDQAKTRFQHALEVANRIQAKQSSDVDIQYHVFGERTDLLSRDALNDLIRSNSSNQNANWPNGHVTDLATIIRDSLRSAASNEHSIVLLSDGAHNASTSSALKSAVREANAMATPIYTLTIGSSVGIKNLSLISRKPRMIAFPDMPVSLNCEVGHNGLAGMTTKVHLYRGDTLISSKPVRLAADGNSTIHFELPKGVEDAIEQYRFVAEEVPGEVTTADNQTSAIVQRLNAPVSVLFLEGKPYWDSKFLARNLGNDPVVNLESIVQLKPGRFLQRTMLTAKSSIDVNQLAAVQGEPATADKLDVDRFNWSIENELKSPLEDLDLLRRFRVVVLGRDADSYLTEQGVNNLREWITLDGGCLMCSRGAPSERLSDRLAEILPVRWVQREETHFRTRISGIGNDSQVFESLLRNGPDPLGTLPSLASSAIPKQRAGLPQVLIEGSVTADEQMVPVVTYQPYGKGQTVVVEGAGMWRWAFLPPEHAEKDAIYPTLWQSMVQWIISQNDTLPGDSVAVRSDRASFMAGDVATASVILNGRTDSMPIDAQELAVMIQAAGSDLPKRLSLVRDSETPGLYRVDMGRLEVGYYTLKVVRGERDEEIAVNAFEVRDPWFESLEVDARPDLMNQIATLSGGRVITEDDIDGIVEEFEQKLKSQRVIEEKRTTMWDRPPVLLAVLGCWIGSWIFRRRSGLL